ncbi:histidinol-phosphate transaminase [Cohnella nanjingensis]|uniref:Histidinol-phosphate aminotransferase n=1 Tax=Cohnella nanjingensis TaxID=1387779 RepID=A0A7X0RQR8_9BACL|nr:histidinol-phosphate transaminase [Cohnella nanjingensis]MBB6670771.1 histidinol-phosphate transaminase [Cohnella nanjingensis]
MCALPIRESLRSIHVYIPAKSTEETKRGAADSAPVVRLAANENTIGFSPLAEQAIREAAATLFLYPDSYSTRLRSKLAASRGYSPDRLLFGNGSFELLSLAALAYLSAGDEAVIPVPSFGWYKVATLAAGGVPVEVPLRNHKIGLDDLKRAITDRTRLIWLCNPNNPTGTYYGTEELEQFLADLAPYVAVVVDEAYYEYAEQPDYPDTVKLLDRYPNLIALRTFSKVYGLAGLRIGYAIAAPETIRTINRIRIPPNVNVLAEAAAAASLDDAEFVTAVLDNNRAGKHYYYESFREMGLAYLPTETNFIMVDLAQDSTPVFQELLRRGVLVRAGSDFGMPTWLRITIGKPEENRLVIEKLNEVLAARV